MKDRGGTTGSGTVGWVFGRNADAAKAVARLREAGFADVRLSQRTGWTSKEHVPEQEGHTAVDFASSLQAGGFDSGDARAFTDAVASGATLLTLDAAGRAGEAVAILRGETVVTKAFAPFDAAAASSTTQAQPQLTPAPPLTMSSPSATPQSAAASATQDARTTTGIPPVQPAPASPPAGAYPGETIPAAPPAPYSGPEAPSVGSVLPVETSPTPTVSAPEAAGSAESAPSYAADDARSSFTADNARPSFTSDDASSALTAEEAPSSPAAREAASEPQVPDSPAPPQRRGIIRTDR